ncbi:MAG: undecaprenyl-diphosphate phosphatase [Betaproteobacteria bacterium]|nr:MAG: undecaprenyl-diphosphate phosphatase [Betaproteobacteria bacterium]
MESALLAKAFVLGVVEGLTEFLPISSTGHLILVGDLIGFADEKAKVFEIVIQTGAMLAIVWEYRERFGRVLVGLATDRTAQRFALNLLVAFTPAAVLGLAFGKLIKTYLFHAVPVALAFIVGAIIILWVERRRRPAMIENVDQMTWKDALKVGVAQAFALIPGTSRSGATIIGGMLFGLSRRAATEFSFFLAVPTLVAAGAYDFWKNRALFDSGDVGMFAVGSIAAFVSAFLCVRWLLRYIATHDFTPFAWYRIAFGAAVLATAYAGVVNWSAL